jgi:hypothetical protein
MYRKVLVLLFIQVCLLHSIKAQDPASYKPVYLFGIYSGLTYHILADEAMFEDVYFSGIFAPIYVNYRYFGTKTRQTCSFYFDQLNLNSSNAFLSNQLSVNNTNAILEYSYNRHIFSIPKYNIQCFAGGKIQSLVNYRLYYDYQYDQNEVMADLFTTLGFNFIAEKRFSKNNDLLNLNISIPFAAYSLVNNVYNQWSNSVSQEIAITNQTKISINDLWRIIKNGEFITFNKLIGFQSEISYTKFLSNHIGLELNGSILYYSFAQYSDLLYSKNFSSKLLVGVVFKK